MNPTDGRRFADANGLVWVVTLEPVRMRFDDEPS